MKQGAEIFNSEEAETIAEIDIEYLHDEEITVPQFAYQSKLLIGKLGDDFVVSATWRSTGTGRGILVFERGSGSAVCDAIDRILASPEPWETPIEISNGSDRLTVTFSSSWSHTVPAPLERLNIRNRRNYVLDGVEAAVEGISLPPASARRFADEMRRAATE